jgi:hypothetical protein
MRSVLPIAAILRGFPMGGEFRRLGRILVFLRMFLFPAHMKDLVFAYRLYGAGIVRYVC